EIAPHFVIEDRDISGGLIGDQDFVLILVQLSQDPAGRDHVVVGMRREDDDPLSLRELALPAHLRAERVEHGSVELPGGTVAAPVRSTSPSLARFTSAALCSPVARSAISLDATIVPTPIVIASVGTFSAPKKSAAATRRVMESSTTSRVRDVGPEPGSLNPMCPVWPIPRIWKSMPPASAIALSYSRACASIFPRGRSPRGMCT